MKNYYHILGLSFESNPEKELIDAAYKALVKIYHPDVYMGDKNYAKEKIQEINVACGGTLFYRVHQEKNKKDHRMPRNNDVSLEEIFKPNHNINFTKNSFFRDLVKKDSFMVNSF